MKQASSGEIADALSTLAKEQIGPAQFCFVAVGEQIVGSGSLAFRHNCASNVEVVEALRTIADRIENEERLRHLRREQRFRKPKRLRVSREGK